MIHIKTDEEIGRMRESCRITARVRDAVAEKISPGVTTMELNDYAGEMIGKMGGESAFLGYRGFPGQICVSVNEAVVHGIPSEKKINLGDIVSIDVGVKYDGFIGDTATTVMVGVTDVDVIRLVRTAEEALKDGIAMAKEGRRLSDISHAIEQKALNGGFSVVREFVGHGVGRNMHEDPQIPNFGDPGMGPILRKGMTLAIEPMVNMGGREVRTHNDGWTVLTVDGQYSAHFEHTVVIGPEGAEILTL